MKVSLSSGKALCSVVQLPTPGDILKIREGQRVLNTVPAPPSLLAPGLRGGRMTAMTFASSEVRGTVGALA